MKQLSIIIFFCIVILGCKKEEQNDSNPLNKITIQVKEEVVPLPPIIYNGTYPEYFKTTNIGRNIYLASPSQNNSPIVASYFLKYNIDSKLYSILTPDNSIVAGGYTSKLVNNGTNIFYIANEAKKYNISTNTWSSINYPESAQDNNGEAGIVTNNNKIYFLGGRSITNKFKYYDIQTNQWFNLANAPYKSDKSNLAVVNNKIFAVGGYNNIAYTRIFSVYDIDNNSWDTLPPINFNFYTSPSLTNIVALNDRFIIAINGEREAINGEIVNLNMFIYDTQTNKWNDNLIKINLDYPYRFSQD